MFDLVVVCDCCGFEGLSDWVIDLGAWLVGMVVLV